MLSTAFMNLEIKMPLQIVQSGICDLGRKTRKKIKQSLRPALSLAFRFPLYNSCSKSPATGAQMAGPTFQLASLHPEISAT